MILTILALASAAPACGPLDAHLPRPLAGWSRQGRDLDTGHTVTLPARRGTVETTVHIRKAGMFGVAVDSDGWVDVFPGGGRGAALHMASESRGPACSSIAKILYYRLRPGSYRVTVTKLKANRAKLMLVHGSR